MTKYFKSHYVNSTNGRVYINLSDSGVIITQQTEGGVAGAISITGEEMEKLAKALFAIKKEAFPVSPQSPAISVPSSTNTPNFSNTSTPATYMGKMKEKYEKAYVPWKTEDENLLKKYYSQGLTVLEIAKLLGRNEGAIISRMKKMGI